MKNPISMGVLTGILSLVGISVIAHGFYTGRLPWPDTTNPIVINNANVSTCYEPPPKITSIKFNTEIVKFLVLNDRLHLLMPLPITGSSTTIVDIKDVMKKMRK